MAKLTSYEERAIEAHQAYAKRSDDASTMAWLEAKRCKVALTGKRLQKCGECGKLIASGADIRRSAHVRCPHCGAVLEVAEIKAKHLFHVYQELAKMGDFQAVRYFGIEQYFHDGQPADIGVYHLFDELWDEQGRSFIFSLRISCASYYSVYNPFVKSDPTLIYRKQRNTWHSGWHADAQRVKSLCEWARKRELHKDYCGRKDYQRVFEGVLKSEPFAETLWKADNEAFWDYTSVMKTAEQKAAMRVAWRHGWRDFNPSWFDHIHNICELGLDYRNPLYVAPADFKQAHDHYLQVLIARRQAEERERQAMELATALGKQKMYAKRIKRYAEVLITVGDVEIRPLTSIKEFYDEAQEMRHCVWANKYYEKATSIIFSARVDGKRKETVEVDKKRWKVLQCFGKCNTFSDRHDIVVTAMKNWCEQQKQRTRHA